MSSFTEIVVSTVCVDLNINKLVTTTEKVIHTCLLVVAREKNQAAFLSVIGLLGNCRLLINARLKTVVSWGMDRIRGTLAHRNHWDH